MASIAPEALTLETGFTCRKRGVETRIVLADGSARPDRLLIQSLSKAHVWWSALRTGMSMKDLADQEGVSQRRVANILTLAFLAPDITEAIVQGRQPAWLTADALIRNPIPLLWSEQREALTARHI